jgi:hypothetical protein
VLMLADEEEEIEQPEVPQEKKELKH